MERHHALALLDVPAAAEQIVDLHGVGLEPRIRLHAVGRRGLGAPQERLEAIALLLVELARQVRRTHAEEVVIERALALRLELRVEVLDARDLLRRQPVERPHDVAELHGTDDVELLQGWRPRRRAGWRLLRHRLVVRLVDRPAQVVDDGLGVEVLRGADERAPRDRRVRVEQLTDGAVADQALQREQLLRRHPSRKASGGRRRRPTGLVGPRGLRRAWPGDHAHVAIVTAIRRRVTTRWGSERGGPRCRVKQIRAR